MGGLGSVSRWIVDLRNGHESAAENIWNRYHGRLFRVANRALGRSPRAVADEDDVVVSAFGAFLRRTGEGAYAALATRDDLWRLLATITYSHARKQSSFLTRLRRFSVARQDSEEVLRQLVSEHPSAEVVVIMRENLHVLMAKLGDPELQQIALERLEGHTTAEIAANQHRSVRTIERRLALIREKWQRYADHA